MAWWAALSLALGGLLPLLSHAALRGAVDSGAWVEVCTATGALWVRAAEGPAHGASGDGQSPAMPSMGSSTACGLCAGHAPVPGVAPVGNEIPVGRQDRAVAPVRHADPAHPVTVWPAARPRGPPHQV